MPCTGGRCPQHALRDKTWRNPHPCQVQDQESPAHQENSGKDNNNKNTTMMLEGLNWDERGFASMPWLSTAGRASCNDPGDIQRC